MQQHEENEMLKSVRVPATLVAATALLALPAAAQAKHDSLHGKSKGSEKRCAKAPKVGYSVSGTLVTATADDPATSANEASVTLMVTAANKHARNSGEIADQNATIDGVQVAGATLIVTAAGDAFSLVLDEFEAPDTPSVGDAVKVNGKIARTKMKCSADATSTADRYAAPNIRKLTITDSDPDA
jgi:hypothetical protein